MFKFMYNRVDLETSVDYVYELFFLLKYFVVRRPIVFLLPVFRIGQSSANTANQHRVPAAVGSNNERIWRTVGEHFLKNSRFSLILYPAYSQSMRNDNGCRSRCWIFDKHFTLTYHHTIFDVI